MNPPGITPYPLINDILDMILTQMRGVLGEKLVGLYLYGSLVVGDFDIAMSDIDLLAALADDLNEADFAALDRMHAAVVARFPQWKDRIELEYPSVKVLQTFKTQTGTMGNMSPGEPFHIIDVDADWLPNWYIVQTQGQTLYGPPPAEVIVPVTKAEFVQAIRERHLAYYAGRMQTYESDRRPSQAYIILTMCRVLYTCHHGEQASKIKAAEWALNTYPQWAVLIQTALDWRQNWREHNDIVEDGAEVRRFVAFTIEEVNKL